MEPQIISYHHMEWMKCYIYLQWSSDNLISIIYIGTWQVLAPWVGSWHPKSPVSSLPLESEWGRGQCTLDPAWSIFQMQTWHFPEWRHIWRAWIWFFRPCYFRPPPPSTKKLSGSCSPHTAVLPRSWCNLSVATSQWMVEGVGRGVSSSYILKFGVTDMYCTISPP